MQVAARWARIRSVRQISYHSNCLVFLLFEASEFLGSLHLLVLHPHIPPLRVSARHSFLPGSAFPVLPSPSFFNQHPQILGRLNRAVVCRLPPLQATGCKHVMSEGAYSGKYTTHFFKQPRNFSISHSFICLKKVRASRQQSMMTDTCSRTSFFWSSFRYQL